MILLRGKNVILFNKIAKISARVCIYIFIYFNKKFGVGGHCTPPSQYMPPSLPMWSNATDKRPKATRSYTHSDLSSF